MRKARENEGVVCPDSASTVPYKPEKVYDVKEADGKRVTRGIIPPHKKHLCDQSDECDWVGHPVPVVPVISKQTPPIGFPF